MAATYSIQVSNTTTEVLDVYTTLSPAQTDPPSTNPADYVPTYTFLGTVAASDNNSFNTSEALARVVVTRHSDQFPLKVAVSNALTPGSNQIGLSNTDVSVATSGWSFYQSFASQPYSPVSLNFAALVEQTPVTALNAAALTFFQNNGAPGLTFGLYSAIGYWATNQLYAYPGSYYCYEPPSGSSMGFILPSTPVGTLTIADGRASYTALGESALNLDYFCSSLSSTGATPNAGLLTTAIIRDLAWEGKPDTITWGFVGTLDGQQFIAQSYSNPQIPWYAVAYDLVYGAFFTVQLAMTLDAAINLLGTVGNGLQWLGQNVSKLASRIQSSLNSTGDTAGPGSGVGDSADPVNVDVDIDVDIDVDVDIDIDIDIDVDVDVDIDIDVDVDFIAVVDVDVDVDIDVDIDVVTDTETDIDIDVDTDIDTDVDVQPGAVMKVLNSIGKWVMTKALPTLIEGAVIYVAFQSASKILEAWKTQDEQDIANLQPRQSTGLGLLINYMLQDNTPVATRWQTFSEYVQDVYADAQDSDHVKTLQVTLSSLLQTGNSQADSEAASWRWSDQDQANVVANMKADTGTNTYLAFQILGNTTFQGKPLPVKVGATVAMNYLATQSA